METEIKNTIYIGIACTLLAVVLGFVMVMSNITDSMADARNSEILSKQQLDKYNEFDTYNNKKITGMQLIRLITESSSKDIEIYISGISDLALDGANDPDGNGDRNTQLFSKQLFIKKPNLYSINSNEDTADISNTWLVKMYANTGKKASTACYRTILVYDNANIKTATHREYVGNSVVTGIKVTYEP